MTEHTFNHRLDELYQPPAGRMTLIDVPEMKYMMIDGSGAPGIDAYTSATQWLFSVAYFIKPHIKIHFGKRFVEPPLECLFWSDANPDFSKVASDLWQWRTMIVVLEMVTDEMFSEAVAKVEEKRGPAPASLRMEHYCEGRSVQTKHVGDYAGVQAVCRELYTQFLPANKLKPSGHYHEIYLNDPSRVAPEKRKIVIRQPVK